MNDDKSNRLILPSLIIATLSTYPPSIVAAVLLTEISKDLGVPIGIGGQIRTSASVVAFLGSIAMTFIASRYNYKRLLTVGLLVIAASAVASSLAPSFTMLLLATVLTGAGMAIVVPMTTTLIAEYFPEAEQGRAMSLLGVGGGFGFLLGGTIVGQIAAIGGWRLAYIGFAGSLGALGLIFTYFALPSTENRGSKDIASGLREITSNRSAVGCLVSNLLASAGIQGVYFWCFSFIKETYMASTVQTGYIFTGTAVMFITGSYLTAPVIARLGSRTTTTLGLLSTSICTVVYNIAPTLTIATLAILAGNLLDAFRYNAHNTLSLGQTEAKGSMMSLHNAASNLGYTVGSALGVVLLVTSWQTLGLILTAMTLTAAATILAVVKQPESIAENV
ncbi:MFS transporter [Candidatus Bathyarchaeota archaeon]|nr:MFS transporter [Candidatus Bathyarchaeota archaeon]